MSKHTKESVRADLLKMHKIVQENLDALNEECNNVKAVDENDMPVFYAIEAECGKINPHILNLAGFGDGTIGLILEILIDKELDWDCLATFMDKEAIEYYNESEGE